MKRLFIPLLLLVSMNLMGQKNDPKILDVSIQENHQKRYECSVYKSGLMVIQTYFLDAKNQKDPYYVDSIHLTKNKPLDKSYITSKTGYQLLKSNEYDAKLNVVKCIQNKIDREGLTHPLYTTTFTYDKQNRRIKSIEDSLGKKVTFTYTYSKDSVITKSDQNYERIEYFDSLKYLSAISRTSKNTATPYSEKYFCQVNGSKLTIMEGYHTHSTYEGSITYYHHEFDPNGFLIGYRGYHPQQPNRVLVNSLKVKINYCSEKDLTPELKEIFSKRMNITEANSSVEENNYFKIHLNDVKEIGIMSTDIRTDYPEQEYLQPVLTTQENYFSFMDETNHELVAFNGYLPIQKSYTNYNEITRYIVMHEGTFEMKVSPSKDDFNSPYLIIADPNDPTTWRDSMSKEGKRVYHQTEEMNYQLSGTKWGLMNVNAQYMLSPVYDEFKLLTVSDEQKLINGTRYSEIQTVKNQWTAAPNHGKIVALIAVKNGKQELYSLDGLQLYTGSFQEISVIQKNENFYLKLMNPEATIYLDQNLNKITFK